MPASRTDTASVPHPAKRAGRTRSAVVGLGSISFEHLSRIGEIPGADIVGVCDLSGTLASAVADRLGAGAPFTDFHRMLEETRPDVVHVLTPPRSHHPLALEALASGSHVFVEKPITATWDEYVELREAAQTYGRLVCENYNYRFTDVVLRSIDLCRSGAIGDAVAVQVSFGGVMGATGPYQDRDFLHFSHELPGGALHNFVSHPISLALAFMGNCTNVSVWQRRVASGAMGKDELRALLAGDRASSVIAVTSNTSPPAFSLLVQGTDGLLDVDLYNRRLELHSPRSASGYLLRSGTSRLGGSARLIGRKLSGRHDPYQGLGALLHRFYGAVRDEMPPPVSLAEMDAVNRVVAQLFEPERQL